MAKKKNKSIPSALVIPDGLTTKEEMVWPNLPAEEKIAWLLKRLSETESQLQAVEAEFAKWRQRLS
jgi:hypothetical protein